MAFTSRFSALISFIAVAKVFSDILRGINDKY
jgi:hypothetical protein